MTKLNEQIKEAEGSPTEYEKEIEELNELLPEIREKIEDAKESQHSGNVAELALKATLVVCSTSEKNRRPEKESPQKDDAKKAKQKPEVNGSSGDAVLSGNKVLENMERLRIRPKPGSRRGDSGGWGYS
ncbi:Nuclear autoantigenic sperm protein [Tupaia chinensis]|uniref:Nuclear autoantigenic sperm protein n=1 Tax=Tupaia chinensis TaxID=246437 RepID=L9KHD8_TUPCH|nr:Nuclear autoantigenic sperm protein [Tupaia chinensis]